jgi:uncharacterized membrane protein
MDGFKEIIMEVSGFITLVGELVDFAGVLMIIIGILIATWHFIRTIFGPAVSRTTAYRDYRRGLGQALLLGLELLVAADIIRTVAVTPTLQSVAVLAVIVLIRTFLSWSLEVEVNGRFPWKEGSDTQTKM